MKKTLLLLALTTLIGATGCAKKTNVAQTSATEQTEQQTQLAYNVKTIPTSVAGKDVVSAIAANYPGQVVLIDFWATWCGPCRMQAPILDQLAEEVHEDDLKICKMDVDENPNTARQFGIMSIPTLLFKKDGQVVKQVAGVHTKAQLKEIIAELS